MAVYMVAYTIDDASSKSNYDKLSGAITECINEYYDKINIDESLWYIEINPKVNTKAKDIRDDIKSNFDTKMSEIDEIDAELSLCVHRLQKRLCYFKYRRCNRVVETS